MTLPPEARLVLAKRMSDNLPVLRKVLRINQTQLAIIVGLDRSTIAMFETHVRKMTWPTFLSFLLLFTKRPATNQLLPLMGIYTPELDYYLRNTSRRKNAQNNKT